MDKSHQRVNVHARDLLDALRIARKPLARLHIRQKCRAVVRRALLVVAVMGLVGLGLASVPTMAWAGTDDYPAQWRNAAQDSLVDSWEYKNRECTSFVAWRLHARNGFEMPHAIGNGGTWGSWFAAHGYAVNNTPAMGAIAETSGHVAWVETVNGNGMITIEEYNFNFQGTYNERTVSASGFHYIHAKDLAGAGQAASGARDVPTADGHIQVFITGSGVIRQNWYSLANGQIGGWTQSPGLAAQALGTPAAVARTGEPVIDLFVRGGDGWVYETWYNWGNGAWGGWVAMGGSVSSDPQAVATSDGHVQVFATGGGLARQSWFSPGNGAVGGWATSAGLAAQAIGSPAIVTRSGQSVIDAFVRGSDGWVYETWYNWGNGAWGGWVAMGGAVSSDPQAVATPDGHVQVFATGGGLVQQSWFAPGNGAVGGWATSPGLGAQAVGSPAIVARSGQAVIDAFVRGGDGWVYETWYNWGNGAWGGWIAMGGSVSSDPQAVATSDGHVQVFATGGGLVRQSWFAPDNGAVGGWNSF